MIGFISLQTEILTVILGFKNIDTSIWVSLDLE